MQTELTLREPGQVERAPQQTEAASMMQNLILAASNPQMNVENVERLLGMARTMEADRRKDMFFAALSRLQANLPQIEKTGRIVVKGTERSRYAKLEDIDVAIRPYLAEEGFAFSFDTDSTDGKMFKISAKLSHKDGHSETKTLMLPVDSSEYRSTVQSIGSTVSYGKRQLIKMHVNLVECDEDDDGRGGAPPITEEQARTINDLISEVGGNMAGFKKHFGIDKLTELSSKRYSEALNMIESKRRNAR